ncbi:MAG: hypothetical protein HQK68_02115, partial [Desulfamplus sp.]|nr:hypothetical protein [Desulfamplus sp.]
MEQVKTKLRDKIKEFNFKVCLTAIFFLIFMVVAGTTYAAYHHEGERDSGNFLEVYYDKAGTKLDHCALCHSGGSYTSSTGKPATLGSCQWCHYTTDYGRQNANIEQTINSYGKDYKNNGRSASAISRIDLMDSDQDGSTNRDEILANSFPGNDNDIPSLKMAPSKVYTRIQL